jgi:hypothetical protein
MNQRENLSQQGIPYSTDSTPGQYPARQNIVGYNQSFNQQQQGQVVNGGWNRPNNLSMQSFGQGGIRRAEQVPRNGPNLGRNRFRINQPNQGPVVKEERFNPNLFSGQKQEQTVVPEQNGIDPAKEEVQNPVEKFFGGLRRRVVDNKKEGGDTFSDHLQRMSPNKQGGANKLEEFLESQLPK